MKFDLVLANPPFQDRTARGKTPHKLWIDFTRAAFSRFLKPGGLLLQISPASFQSPSSKVLEIMRTRSTLLINFDVAHHFPKVASSFAYYAIQNRQPKATRLTVITKDGNTFRTALTDQVLWLPADFCDHALEIHRKVMFSGNLRLKVKHDYVTCHNTTLGSTLSKTRTGPFIYPVFHTNPQTWYSSVRQEWANKTKVMWTRSGYTKPFLDLGIMGGTDMVYYVEVPNQQAGENLLHNLSLPLIRYILRTARWSGFGNEIVFERLPDLPVDRRLTHKDICDRFGLTKKERAHVIEIVG